MASYISGFSKYLDIEGEGNVKDLVDDQHPWKAIDDLINNGGLSKYYHTSLTPVELAIRCVNKFKNEWMFELENIDRIIYASSSLWKREYTDRYSISKLITETGLDKAIPVCVYGHGCANFHVAVEIGKSLVESSSALNVLIITTDVAGSQPSRIVNPEVTIVSDGAGCALISKENKLGNSYRLGYINTYFSARLGQFGPEETRSEYFSCVVEGVRNVVKKTIMSSECSRESIDIVIPNNYKKPLLEMFSILCGIPTEKMYTKNISKYAHCFASDAILSLCDFNNTDYGTILALATGTQSCASMMMYKD